MKHGFDFLAEMIEKGGPESSEYQQVGQWLDLIAGDIQNGKIDPNGLKAIRDSFGDAITTHAIQGFIFQKPHGYSGDFEIIDKIYQQEISADPRFYKWDFYAQSQKALIALRNRKNYFISLLNNLERTEREDDPIWIMNVASGPMRDVYEYLRSPNDGRLMFDCVDHDKNAIAYGKEVCKNYANRIRVHLANAFRFKAQNTYNLIWSAGLFDCLGSRKFEYLLKRLLHLLSPRGEIVIGNFSTYNPSRSYMELVGDWYLHHRSAEELIDLALDCGLQRDDIRIGKEPEGVNYFVHIKRGDKFIPFDRELAVV